MTKVYQVSVVIQAALTVNVEADSAEAATESHAIIDAVYETPGGLATVHGASIELCESGGWDWENASVVEVAGE